MKIDQIRIYAECLEQGLDFKEYILGVDEALNIQNIYLPKFKNKLLQEDSRLLKILKLKSFDVVISIISNDCEIPILLIEYSTAVPTDDHKMQRSDVYFWAGVFSIPTMKISPSSKGSFNNHGGGDKITNAAESLLALNNNALVYFVDFQSNNNVLITKKDGLSCVRNNKEIKRILSTIIQAIKQFNAFDLAYKHLIHLAKKEIKGDIKSLQNIFTESKRFHKENQDMIVKINRFGHAMDPDRGILFFINMLFGNNHTITKFVIKRERENGKESSKTLFDAISETKMVKINQLLKQKINAKIALEIFTIVTGIFVALKQVSNNSYIIEDEDFLGFLCNYTSNVYKSIFLNSKSLRLCDYKDNILCEICWNPNIATRYKNLLKKYTCNTPLLITPLDFKNAKEDIVTFASVAIFKKIGCEILAVSYPGAQGDRAILVGNGRGVKRIYVDIIASKQGEKFYVFLHENKDESGKISKDSLKLQSIKANNSNEINILLHKLNKKPFEELFLGIGFKYDNDMLQQIKNIDYIFTFDLNTDSNYTNIFFNIGIINLDLIGFFKPIANHQNKLQGIIKIDKIYRIDKI